MKNVQPLGPEWSRITPSKVKFLQNSPDYNNLYSNLSTHNILNWFTDIAPSYIATINGNTLLTMLELPDYSYKIWLLGANKPIKTIESLQESHPTIYIPEYVFDQIQEELYELDFHVLEDKTSSEYIYETQLLSELKGANYARIRSKVNGFNRSYPGVTTKYAHNVKDFLNAVPIDEVLSLFDNWSKYKEVADGRFFTDERKSLVTLLTAPRNRRNSYIFQAVLNENNKPIAIWIGQVVDPENIITYYSFYDDSFEEVSCYAYVKYAEHCLKEGIQYMNIEQDLGINGLKIFKEQLRPQRFNRIYSVSKHNSSHLAKSRQAEVEFPSQGTPYEEVGASAVDRRASCGP